MSGAERHNIIGDSIYWGSIAILIFALKQFYSAASADQLQWMLRPLVMLLELFSDLSFAPTPDSEWLDVNRRIAIVKSCAGVNFFIISLLGYLWQRRGYRRRLRLLVQALASAWLTALLANTLRILFSVYWEDSMAAGLGLSERDCHRAIGIAVYFSCLWAQLACYRLQGFSRTVVTASACYLSITLLLPLLRAWLLGLEPVSLQHRVWVAGIPLAMTLLGYCFGTRSRS
jgi:exosortase K